jgi:protein MPE1
VKRTTGIPKSFLKTVDKATVLGQNADGDDSKTPSGIMVNPDGEWVVAEPDKASWEQFQAKAKSNNSAQKAALEGDKEVQERGLECPIDKKMFIDPMKTPCCETTYCNDCITNALIESDFICPGCKSDGVLIDDLKPDSEAVEKMKDFLAEKESKAKEDSKSPKSPASLKSPGSDHKAEPVKAKSKSKSPPPSVATTTTSHASQPSQTAGTTLSTPHSAPSTPANGEQQGQGPNKKRPAEESLENPKIPKAPKAMQQTPQPDVAQQQQQQQQQVMLAMMNGGMNGMSMMNPMAMPMMYPGMPMMGGFGGMPNMNMANMGMMNPMMGNGMPGYPMNNGFQNGMQAAGMWGAPNQGVMGMNAAGVGVGQNMNSMGLAGGTRMNNNTYNDGYNHQQQHQHGPGYKNFTHQPADEEDAYFRKPVNPHRHQNRQKRARPSDYREL